MKPRLTLINHPWQAAMKGPDRHDLARYARIGTIVRHVGSFLVVITLTAAICLHAMNQAA